MDKKEFNPWKKIYLDAFLLYLKKAFEETKNDAKKRDEIKALLQEYIDKNF